MRSLLLEGELLNLVKKDFLPMDGRYESSALE
jgi:hypothetical protein